MPGPVETDCDICYKSCKCKCYDALVQALISAGDDAAKEKDAEDRYKNCLAFCKKAKDICHAASD
jgi:hypothetical protein